MINCRNYRYAKRKKKKAEGLGRNWWTTKSQKVRKARDSTVIGTSVLAVYELSLQDVRLAPFKFFPHWNFKFWWEGLLGSFWLSAYSVSVGYDPGNVVILHRCNHQGLTLCVREYSRRSEVGLMWGCHSGQSIAKPQWSAWRGRGEVWSYRPRTR